MVDLDASKKSIQQFDAQIAGVQAQLDEFGVSSLILIMFFLYLTIIYFFP